MSLLPLLLSELEDTRRPSVYDPYYGLGLGDLLAVPARSGYLRPWRLAPHNDSGISNIQNDKKEFKVNLDVQQFKPEEINVKTAGDYITVEAKHEERSDEHGFVSRQFTRRYLVPQDVNKDAITSTLSSDGVLTIHAPKKAIAAKDERNISITQTNKPALKQGKKDGKPEKMET